MDYKDFKTKVLNDSLRDDTGKAGYEAYSERWPSPLSWEELVSHYPEIAFNFCRAAKAVEEIVAAELY